MKYALFGIAAAGWAAAASAGLNDKLPPEAYRNPVDRQIVETGKGVPGRPYPCSYEEVVSGHKAIASTPTEFCVKMLPQQRWRGLWRAAFEGSRFCPEPAETCDDNTPGEQIWLSRTPGQPTGGLYRVDFIGRRTMYKGPYGHFGMFDQELIMDRVISIKLIEDAPPVPPHDCKEPDCIPISIWLRGDERKPK